MSDWEITNLQKQIDRIEEKLQVNFDRINERVQKDRTKTYIWLIVLSNLLFLIFIHSAVTPSDKDTNEQLAQTTKAQSKK